MNRLVKEKRISRIYRNFVGQKNIVIGCGVQDGITAIARLFPDAHWYAIDLDVKNRHIGENFEQIYGNAEQLQFPDQSFDFIYCYHVLEHVSNVEIVIGEMVRVLKPDGVIFIGTPNKDRLIGYLTSEATLKEFLRWNMQDYYRKFKGEWRNELGAHAGFSNLELQELLKKNFHRYSDISNEYFFSLHTRFRIVIRTLISMRLTKWLYPSIYYIAFKNGDSKED